MTQSCHEAGRRKDAPGSEALIMFLLFLLLKDTLNLGFFRVVNRKHRNKRLIVVTTVLKLRFPFFCVNWGPSVAAKCSSVCLICE